MAARFQSAFVRTSQRCHGPSSCIKSSTWKTKPTFSQSSTQFRESLQNNPSSTANRFPILKSSKVQIATTNPNIFLSTESTKANSIMNCSKKLPPSLKKSTRIPVVPRGSFNLLPFLWFLSADDDR